MMRKVIKTNTVFLVIAFLAIIVLSLSCIRRGNTLSDPPRLIKNPASIQKYSPGSGEFTGSPCIAISDSGRIWAAWTTEPSTGKNSYIVVTTSCDKGQTWEEVLAITPGGKGESKIFAPQAWVDPDGQLWLFWNQTTGQNTTTAEVWSITTTTPDVQIPMWSEPKRLTDGIIIGKPIVTSNGEGIFTVSIWNPTGIEIRVMVTNDHGQTWHVRRSINFPQNMYSCNQHTIVERRDRSLWMLVSTKDGIAESVSTDEGLTWRPLIASVTGQGTSDFFIMRLNSGNLLLVTNGYMETQLGLMAFISKDDGLSWSDGLLLDGRSGILCPDGQQVKYGALPCECKDQIYVIYIYSGRDGQKIFMTGFTEEDVAMGSTTETISLQIPVGKSCVK